MSFWTARARMSFWTARARWASHRARRTGESGVTLPTPCVRSPPLFGRLRQSQQFPVFSLFRTDLHKSDGFRERERERPDLCFQNRQGIAFGVRRCGVAESPERRQTCQNVRHGGLSRKGGNARRDTPLEGGWWRECCCHRNFSPSDGFRSSRRATFPYELQASKSSRATGGRVRGVLSSSRTRLLCCTDRPNRPNGPNGVQDAP